MEKMPLREICTDNNLTQNPLSNKYETSALNLDCTVDKNISYEIEQENIHRGFTNSTLSQTLTQESIENVYTDETNLENTERDKNLIKESESEDSRTKPRISLLLNFDPFFSNSSTTKRISVNNIDVIEEIGEKMDNLNLNSNMTEGDLETSTNFMLSKSLVGEAEDKIETTITSCNNALEIEQLIDDQNDRIDSNTTFELKTLNLDNQNLNINKTLENVTSDSSIDSNKNVHQDLSFITHESSVLETEVENFVTDSNKKPQTDERHSNGNIVNQDELNININMNTENVTVRSEETKKEMEELQEATKLQLYQTQEELNKANEELIKYKTENENFKRIMKEFDELIIKQTLNYNNLNKEHVVVKGHLATLELAFSDTLQKYERCKKIIEGYKTNEASLLKSLATSEEVVSKTNQKYEALKAHTQEKLKESNKELCTIRHNYDNESLKLKNKIKRLEIKQSSLEDSLDQKTKECQALTILCDELTEKI